MHAFLFEKRRVGEGESGGSRVGERESGGGRVGEGE